MSVDWVGYGDCATMEEIGRSLGRSICWVGTRLDDHGRGILEGPAYARRAAAALHDALARGPGRWGPTCMVPLRIPDLSPSIPQ